MELLTREQIESSSDLPTLDVEVPEWGGTVRIRTISGGERDAWEGSIIGDKRKLDIRNLRARFVCLIVIDGNGRRMFTEADANVLGRKSAKALDRIFEAGQILNGMRNRDIEELEKNSESCQSVDSGTSSRSISE